MLYSTTIEHADHLLCEKDAYARLTPLQQCQCLADTHGRPFDYEASLEFDYNKRGDSYELVIWDPSKGIVHGDVLRAVALPPTEGITSACLFITNAGQLTNAGKPVKYSCVLSQTCEDPERRGAYERSDEDRAPVQVICGVRGVPMVALTHASLSLSIRICGEPAAQGALKSAVCTIRVLPISARRATVMAYHTIKTYREYFLNEKEGWHVLNDVRIFKGVGHEHRQRGGSLCCLM